MISIFNSTTDYKEFVATNCDKIRKKDGKDIQKLRFWMRPSPALISGYARVSPYTGGEAGCVSPGENTDFHQLVNCCSY